MKSLIKNFIFIILIFLIIGGIFSLVSSPFEKVEKVSITKLAKEINEEKVKKITVFGEELSVLYIDDKIAVSRKEPNSTLFELLTSYGVCQEKLNKVEIEIELPSFYQVV